MSYFPVGSGGNAPADAQYVTAAAHAGLSSEVVATAAGVALIDDADATAQRTTLGLGTMATEAAASYQAVATEDAANGYAGLNAASRITKGAITTDDLIVNDSTKGLVLKDAAGTPHFWRVGVDTLGALTTADLGTSPP